MPETAANLTMMMTLVLLLVKKSILNVDFNRKIIKLLHLWPGTFLLLFYFECFDQFWSYSNLNPINKFADKNLNDDKNVQEIDGQLESERKYVERLAVEDFGSTHVGKVHHCSRFLDF